MTRVSLELLNERFYRRCSAFDITPPIGPAGPPAEAEALPKTERVHSFFGAATRVAAVPTD